MNFGDIVPKNATVIKKKRVSYRYDALNRITAGISANSNYNLNSVAYDKNGNITNLSRNGHLNSGATSFGLMDDLTYSYDSGNKLTKVQDIGNTTYGFKDGANTTIEYTYDANGNMLKDYNKGITTDIQYNHLNLPTTVALGGGNITYVYDATGVKQRKIVSTGTTTDYAGNFVYENNVLQFFNHSEGYVKNDNGVFSHVYQYKDHLGNVRISYADSNNDGVIIASTEIIEESNYYPFGGSHKGYNNVVSSNGNALAQKFKFGGKELSEELGLNTYDFGARNYDPYLGRWMNIDPLAERYTNYTPYNYVANTPLQAIDPDGRAIIFIGGLRFAQSDSDQQQGLGSADGFMGRRSLIYRNDITNYWSTDENSHGRSASIDQLFMRTFNDKNAFYLSGSSTHQSSAQKRQGEGGKKAELFHKTYGYGAGKNRKIKNGEKIRVVGHSQGGAHAAGFVSQLLTYKNESGGNLYNVEVIFYLNPHQPGDIISPNGVSSITYQAVTDQITGDGLMSFLGLNGGSELDDIGPRGTNYYMRVFEEGEEGTWNDKRGGHNVTDGDQNIATVVADFCRKNPTKCTEIKLIKKD